MSLELLGLLKNSDRFILNDSLSWLHSLSLQFVLHTRVSLSHTLTPEVMFTHRILFKNDATCAWTELLLREQMTASGLPLPSYIKGDFLSDSLRKRYAAHWDFPWKSDPERLTRPLVFWNLTGKLHLRAAQWAAHQLARLANSLPPSSSSLPASLLLLRAAALWGGVTQRTRAAGSLCASAQSGRGEPVVSVPPQVRPSLPRSSTYLRSRHTGWDLAVLLLSQAAQGAFLIEALIARLHGHSCHFLTVETSQAKINMDKGMSRG